MNDFWNKRLGSDDDYRRDELIKKIVDVIEHVSIDVFSRSRTAR